MALFTQTPACQQAVVARWLPPRALRALQEGRHRVPKKLQELGRGWGLGGLDSGLEILYPVQKAGKWQPYSRKKKIYWSLGTVS